MTARFVWAGALGLSLGIAVLALDGRVNTAQAGSCFDRCMTQSNLAASYRGARNRCFRICRSS